MSVNAHKTRQETTLFSFPIREPKRLRQWLYRLGLRYGDITASSRVCYDHFDPESLESGRIASILGTISRRTLRPNALSMKRAKKSWDRKAKGNQVETSGDLLKEKQKKATQPVTSNTENQDYLTSQPHSFDSDSAEEPLTDVPSESLTSSTASVNVHQLPITSSLETRSVQVDTSELSKSYSAISTKEVTIQVKPSTKDAETQYDCDDIYQSLLCDHSYSKRESTPIAETPCNTSQHVAHSPLSTTEDQSHNAEDTLNDTSYNNASAALSLEDLSVMSVYQPSDEAASVDDQTSLTSSFHTTTQESHIHDRKFIVFESSLSQLVQRCPVCGKVVLKTHKFIVGSCLSIITECCADHTYKWTSQPRVRGMASGNLLLPASILLSGSTYNKFSHLAELLNLQIISSSEFYRIQDVYLFPVINEAWKLHQETVLAVMEGSPLKVSGDGRCDSPGYSAKYGSYTVMEQQSGAILDFQLVQCSEVSSSHAMEKMGLDRSLQKMTSCGLHIDILATDRHPQISKFMRTEHTDINHQYDMWHIVKSVTKKLSKKAAQKSCTPLLKWITSITNHLWWSAATCKRDAILLQEKWTSIISHTANIHSWIGNYKFHQCAHPTLSHEEQKQKTWLKIGSKAHEALKSVVLNKKLLKDIRQLTHFCHTGELEAYHAMLTKYCPKREHFSYKGMTARLQLASLDHNMNLSRKQATTKTGEQRYKLVHPKAKKDWVAKPIYEGKHYTHLTDLMLDTISLRESEGTPIKGRKARKPEVQLPDTIARVDKPPKLEVIAKHRTRMTSHN